MANIGFDHRGWIKHLGIAKEAISDKRVKGIIQDEVIKTYHLAIEETPQYSGYLASNLRIQVNGIGGGVATDLQEAHENWHELGKEYGGIKEKGDEYAIGVASVYNRWFNDYDTNPTFGVDDTISIRYLAPHWRIAEVGVKLREINKPGKALARAKANIHHDKRIVFSRYIRSGVKI